MRRSAATIAVLGAALAALGVGYLALGAGRGADRGAKAPGVAQEALATAKAPTPNAPLGSLPALPAQPQAANGATPTAPKAPAAPAPAERAPASDPTKAPVAPPGPRGVNGAVAGAPAAPAAELDNAEVLARIQSGEKGFEVLASRVDLGKVSLAPSWEANDAWIVETYYRQMQASNEVWSGPAFWRFHVARETGFRDHPCFEVIVTRLDGEMPPTTLYVTRDGYRLAGLTTSVMQGGKSREVTWAPSEGEVSSAAAAKAPLTIVPFDLPPLGAEARVTPPGLAPEPPIIEGAGRSRLPTTADLLGAGDALYALEYENPVDGTAVHQRWTRADMRWPVESRTETTWSFRRKAP